MVSASRGGGKFSGLLSWRALAVLGLGLFTINPKAAKSANPADVQQNNEWLQTHLLSSPARLPFSFVYGAQSSESLLKDWVRGPFLE